MHAPKNTLISVYDALHELAHFAYPQWLDHAKVLGEALGHMGVGGITRSGSPVTSAVLASMSNLGSTALVVSPAANEYEHARAFRLPSSALPTIYSGRGALGADVTALASSSAVLVVGEDEEALMGILGCADGHGIGIAVLCAGEPSDIARRLLVRYPSLDKLLFVSNDPNKIVKFLTESVRRKKYKNP